MNEDAWGLGVARVTFNEAQSGRWPQHAWLLRQSVQTRPYRAMLLSVMDVAADASIVDVGAGTGALTLDLLGQAPQSRALALDLDATALDLLARLARSLGVEERLEVRTAPAEATGLETGRFDWSVCRYLLQHVPDPAQVVREMARITRPGGRVALMDIDDGVDLAYPPYPEAVRRLYDAVGASQRQAGGDRHVGRKLHHLLVQAGLQRPVVVFCPHIQSGVVRDLQARDALYERIVRNRPQVVAGALMTGEQFDDALMALRDDLEVDRFVMTGEFLAMGWR